MLLAAVNERLDVFFVYSAKGAESAGLYGAVLTLAVVPDILGGCLSTILQPRIVRIRDDGAFALNMRRFLMLSVPVCGAALLAALLLAEPVIPLVLGAKYVPAIPAFQWLLAGTLFWLAVTPLPLTLVAVLAPERIVFVTIGQSCIVLFGGFVMLPALGVLGMAQAMFAMRIVVALAVVAVARGIVTASPRVEAA